MVNEIIVDTSALIEYVFATDKGKKAKEIIENPENVIFISAIVIGELVSKLERSGVDNIEELVTGIGNYSVTVPLEWETCFKAGRRHAELRKIEKNVSLIDCIIMELAEEHGGAAILTKDAHFEQYKNVKLI